jgi:hypothetical protein
MEPEPTPPRSHAAYFALAILSFAGFALWPGEGGKILVSLFSALLLVVVMLVFMRRVFGLRPPVRWIVVAAAAALGNCGGQVAIFHTDLTRIERDMAHFNCLEARRIVATGRGFGRDWKPHPDQEDTWVAKPPSVWSYHDLYLRRINGPEHYLLQVAMPDMPRALGSCEPDPTATRPAVWN